MTITVERSAPPARPGALEWIRKNLFSTWYNTLLTILGATVVYFALVSVITWMFKTADWRPVTVAPLLYMVGQYPREELWRVGVSVLMVTFLIGMGWGVWKYYVRPFAIFLGILMGILAVFPLETTTITLPIRGFMLINPFLIYLGYRIGRLRSVHGRLVTTLWLVALLLIPLVILPGFDNPACFKSRNDRVGWSVNHPVALGGRDFIVIPLWSAIGARQKIFPSDGQNIFNILHRGCTRGSSGDDIVHVLSYPGAFSAL
jgi:hypothetical protein